MRWIYFVVIDNERITIGRTNNLRKRLRQYERTKLENYKANLLAAVEGKPADEGHVQRYFAEDAIKELCPNNNGTPEVFHPTPRLTNYIRWLRNQWFTLVDLEDSIDGVITFEAWGPTEERQVPPAHDPLFPPDFLEFNERIITADDYYTNLRVLDCVRSIFGEIDLDPASHPMANKHVGATTFYSIQDDGLQHPWHGRVWLNPPFSQWQQWVPKICEEWNSGRVEMMCVYSAVRTITAQYFRRILDNAKAICIITGRLKHGGKGGDSPDDGHCVFYFGHDCNRFCQVFSKLGSVWETYND